MEFNEVVGDQDNEEQKHDQAQEGEWDNTQEKKVILPMSLL